MIESPSVPPTTTVQEDITLAGQRRINLIWEHTQAIIALMVVVANLIAGIATVFGKGKEIPAGLSNTLFLVIGFYFSRTNHAAVGGIGSKPESKYTGR